METAIFETAMGTFGLGWTDVGLARVLLPGDSPEVMHSRLQRNGATPGKPSWPISDLINRIEAYAEGQRVEFSDVTLDLRGVSDFHRRAYDVLLDVKWGETRTYGEIAIVLGDIGLSRAVGQAMGANPMPLVIPCHRVLAGGGRPGGFSAPGGASSKIKMLAMEGVSIGTPAGQMTFGF